MTTDAPPHVRLPDGRQLAWAEYGDRAGVPALYFHGTPGGRLEGRLLDAAAREQGVRLIALDRPGYGHSDVQPGRRLSDFPADVLAVAGVLGLERFAVIGLSGGGPHAQACAASIPEQLTSATIVSGAGSPDADLDGRRGIARLLIRLRLWMAPILAWWIAMWTAFWAPHARPWMMPRAIDRNVVRRPGMAQHFIEEARDALCRGGSGMAQDLALFARPWGFSPSDAARVPVLLWHGEADRIVPARIGRYFARTIPGCRATFFPGEEHLMVIDHASEILAAVVDAAR